MYNSDYAHNHILACTPDNCCGSATGWREAWADMLPDQQKMWTTLGWKNVTWDDSIDSLVPREHLFCWENATKVQLNAASSLCYTRDSWDGDVARRYQVICGKYSILLAKSVTNFTINFAFDICFITINVF